MITTKQYEYHPIANTYPMMEDKEFDNLVGSMEDNGFDSNHPITIYEGEILDGRNRYKAALEAEVEAKFQTFEGSLDEAVERSRQLNSFRRQLTPPQKAMIAANEVIRSRESDGKKISVSKAAAINAIGETYVKKAIKITEADSAIAENIFNGRMSIYEAEYRIDEIGRLREPKIDDIIPTQSIGNDEQTQGVIDEFNGNHHVAAKRVVDLQDKYKDLVKKLKECEERHKKQSA